MYMHLCEYCREGKREIRNLELASIETLIASRAPHLRNFARIMPHLILVCVCVCVVLPLTSLI